MNQAQKVLMVIGGTAQLVAGHMEHYWADASTEKKPVRRIGKGNFGVNIMAQFDRNRGDLQDRQQRHAEYVEHQRLKKELRAFQF